MVVLSALDELLDGGTEAVLLAVGQKTGADWLSRINAWRRALESSPMENRRQIESLLRAVFGELREEDQPGFEKKREEFVFHMTDWLDDLDDLIALFRSENATKEAAARQIVGFLYHVPPHLNAAGRLLLDGIPDPFTADGEHPVEEPPPSQPRR